MSGVAPPVGAPIAVEIDGILDGRIQHQEQLTQAANALSQCGIGGFQCEITGGRFSLLPQATRLPGSGFGEAAQARFLDGLNALCAAAVAGSVESTLRCRMVYAEQVAETLFVVRGAVVEPLTRMRPRLPDESTAAAAPGKATLPFGLGRRELFVIGPLLAVLGMVMAWQSGLVDQMLAARAEAIAVETGPFGKLLDVRFRRSWGNYEIEIYRGPDYPKDPKALNDRRDAAASLTERAACDAAGNGGEAWLQLRNSKGKVVAAQRFELRELLVSTETPVKARLPGRIDAAGIVVSLTRDEPKK